MCFERGNELYEQEILNTEVQNTKHKGGDS